MNQYSSKEMPNKPKGALVLCWSGKIRHVPVDGVPDVVDCSSCGLQAAYDQAVVTRVRTYTILATPSV